MPRRTQVYQQVPWTGGVNTSVDAGILPPNDLVQADNVVFASSGSRLKREGFSYFDTAIPAVTHRSSSGTTRTLVFASTIKDAGSPADHILVAGEKITVTGGPANYNTTEGIISAITTTTTTNDTISYTFSGAGSLTESSTATSAITVSRNYDIIAVYDFWYFNSSNNSKTQTLVAVTSQGLMFRYDANGKRKEIPKSASGATTLAVTTLTSADLRTYNNKLIWTMSGVGNTPKYYDPVGVGDEWKDVPGSCPDASISMEHQGRLWLNDKLNPDLLHYSPTFDETQWLGLGDSGGFPIAEGDGDNTGITAIYPPFKGILVVAKGNRTFRLDGGAPEEYTISPMTNGLGAISHKSVVAVDLDDLFYFSARGVHSLAATDQYGDFSGAYISRDIQPTFNDWNETQLRYSQGAFLPKLNSVVWTVAEDGASKPNALWLFNPFVKNAPEDPGVWYRWPNLNAQSVCVRMSSDVPRIVCGNNAGRIMIGQNSGYSDFSTSGISFRAKTGTIYVDGNPQTIKGFKKFGLLFRPRGSYNFTVYFKVDSNPAQALVFTQSQTGDTLGGTLTLGSGILGNTSIMAPYMKDVVGHGRGCTIEVFQTGTDAQIEIYGFLIEYESADIADEVVQEG